MSPQTNRTPGWLPISAIAFCGGMLVYAVLSGVLTGSRQEALAASEAAGFEAGYAQARAEGPRLDSEERIIHIIASAVFMGNMEVELKAIARNSNAIDFTYGEKGGKRNHVPALRVGDSIAERLGNNLYVIRNVSVSANLQRATVEVTRVSAPILALE